MNEILPEPNRIELSAAYPLSRVVFLLSSALISFRFKKPGGHYSPFSSSPPLLFLATQHGLFDHTIRQSYPSYLSPLLFFMELTLKLNTESYPRQERQRYHHCGVSALRL